ncbi:MAG: 50S ribosome-binding GTPase [Bacilli bacterium]|nr:50S ribosome-binding GTPase [Bacilli bacterium]
MTKCNGCGSVLQDIDENKVGYTKDLKNNLCQRCFRIANYNDYKIVPKNNEEFIKILENINKTKSLVLLVVDLLNISKTLDLINKHISNDIILVLSKRDLLPKDINEEKFLNYLNIKCIDKIIVSSKTNYNMDKLMEMIEKYQTNKGVYVVGITNAGKSSLINKIIYNYSTLNRFITTSNLPSTTLDTIDIEINDKLTLIDTPGIIDDGNIINFIKPEMIKEIIPRSKIKPITYQAKSLQSIIIEDMLRIDTFNTNITLFMSNSLKIERKYKNTDKLKELKKHIIDVKAGSDVVVTGLCFIKVAISTKMVIYAKDGIDIYIRKSLI